MKKIISLILVTLICVLSVFPVFASAENTTKLGDVDQDSDVTILDAVLIQLYLARLSELTIPQIIAGDVDQNELLSIMDSTYIQLLLAEIIDQFPSEPTEPLPELNEKLQAVADKTKALQDDNTLTLTLMSDSHYIEGDAYNESKMQTIKDMGLLQKHVKVDFFSNLGDFVYGNDTKENTLSELSKLLTAQEENSTAPVLNVRGNHDDNGWYSFGGYGGSYKVDEMINDEEWVDIAMSNLPSNFVFDKNNPNGGYGYIDHESSKIRVFVLNSCDLPYEVQEDGTYRYNSYQGHCFSDSQLDFVGNSLMFSDKENPNEWGAIFLTHVPLDTSNLDGERFGGKSALIRGHEYLLGIISAYRKGTAFKASGSTYNPSNKIDKAEDFMVDVDVDYSKKGNGEVIAFFSGHTHTDNYCDEVGMVNSLSYGYTFIGVVGSNSFSNIVIDRDDKSISVVKYGDVYPEKTAGNLISAPDKGSINDGEYTVYYDQFLPTGEKLSPGISEVHPIYHNFDSTSGADLTTMEILGSEKITIPRQMSKIVPVKPFTTYVLPYDFSGECLSFNSWGKRSTYMKIVDDGKQKTFTTGIRVYFVGFSMNTDKYKDYENVHITETAYGLTY